MTVYVVVKQNYNSSATVEAFSDENNADLYAEAIGGNLNTCIVDKQKGFKVVRIYNMGFKRLKNGSYMKEILPATFKLESAFIPEAYPKVEGNANYFEVSALSNQECEPFGEKCIPALTALMGGE